MPERADRGTVDVTMAESLPVLPMDRNRAPDASRSMVAGMTGSPRPRRNRERVFASLLTVALVAGCGGAHKQQQVTQSDQQLVTQALRSYLHAQATGDGQTSCSLLTAGAQQQLIALVVKDAQGLITTKPSCVDAVRLVSEVAATPLLSALENAQIERVKVNGNTASAEVVDGTEFPPQQVALTKVGTAWSIAAVPQLSGVPGLSG